MNQMNHGYPAITSGKLIGLQLVGPEYILTNHSSAEIRRTHQSVRRPKQTGHSKRQQRPGGTHGNLDTAWADTRWNFLSQPQKCPESIKSITSRLPLGPRYSLITSHLNINRVPA